MHNVPHSQIGLRHRPLPPARYLPRLPLHLTRPHGPHCESLLCFPWLPICFCCCWNWNWKCNCFIFIFHAYVFVTPSGQHRGYFMLLFVLMLVELFILVRYAPVLYWVCFGVCHSLELLNGKYYVRNYVIWSVWWSIVELRYGFE
jgi:hypothetical protein